MRYSKPMFATLVALSCMSTAQAAEPVFVPASDYQVAQRTYGEDDAAQEERDLEEERRDRAEQRHDREQQRRDRAEARRQRAEARRDSDREDRVEDRRETRREILAPRPRAWIGVGAGGGFGSVAVPCAGSTNGSKDCSAAGNIGTYSANVTITGPYSALRVRGIREQDRDGNKYVPYEEAALVGSRFGHSNWYGLVGVGRVVHPDDKHPDDTHGFAWEILFAPSSMSATGMELSFQGELGDDVDFVALNLGLRFGQLR